MNLDVSGNRLSYESATYIEKLLLTTTTLKILNVSSCLYLLESSRKVLKGLIGNNSV